MELTIDAGTVVLVAEILKAERGVERPPVGDAQKAIVAAVKRMRSAGAELKIDD